MGCYAQLYIGRGFEAEQALLSLRKPREDVVVVLLLATVAASFYSLTYDRSGSEYILRADESYSFAASVRVVNGNVPQKDFTYSYGPVMPYVYALAFTVFDTSLAVLRASWVVLYVVSTVLSYVLARQVSPRGPALISAALLIGQEPKRRREPKRPSSSIDLDLTYPVFIPTHSLKVNGYSRLVFKKVT